MWKWINTKNGPDESFICYPITDKKLGFKWKRLKDKSGEQIFVIEENIITSPDDPSLRGIYQKDGYVVWYETDDLHAPIAIWARFGRIHGHRKENSR